MSKDQEIKLLKEKIALLETIVELQKELIAKSSAPFVIPAIQPLPFVYPYQSDPWPNYPAPYIGDPLPGTAPVITCQYHMH